MALISTLKLLPFIMISVAISVLLASCGEFDESVFKSNGVYDSKAKKTVFLPQGKSPDGFLPASVSPSLYTKSSGLSKDKHGMPTYKSDNTRHRVVRTTAYSHMEMEVGAPWKKNAVGTYLKYGQVRSAAADWSRYPVGTKFKIKGLPHTYIVDDYGSALVGTNTVDIYNPTLRTMRRWGTRRAEITVIQWGSLERTLNILHARRGHKHCRKMYYAAKVRLDQKAVASN
ncbi:3D domain-containing protein [Akkermansiaceae bacterium]|nr:3D domain-containing protein [Akkermansiaceae bacterium]